MVCSRFICAHGIFRGEQYGGASGEPDQFGHDIRLHFFSHLIESEKTFRN
jgi:hypothetical protein